MNFLLDANVISEAMRKHPSPRVLGWFAAQIEESLFLSALTVGEPRPCALALADGTKRKALLQWIDTGIKIEFADRILPIDTAAMKCWADIQVSTTKASRPLSVMDGLLAATALTHGLTLATRKITDFAATRITLLDPWHQPKEREFARFRRVTARARP